MVLLLMHIGIDFPRSGLSGLKFLCIYITQGDVHSLTQLLCLNEGCAGSW